jgi:hypothetical protein
MRKSAKITIIICLLLVGCVENRSRTKDDMDATYEQKGDSINPEMGDGEGTLGHRFMEPDQNTAEPAVIEGDTLENDSIQ